MRRISIAGIVFIATSAACREEPTPSPTPANTPSPHSPAASLTASAGSPGAPTFGFDFPAVPGWERDPPQALGYEPGFTMAYNLRLPDGPIALTIFVYKRGHSHIPAGASSELVTHELNESLAGLQELVRRQEKYRSADVRARDKTTLGTAPDVVEVQRILLSLSYFDGPPTVSSILVTAAKDHFVKIRITQPGTAAEAEERALRPLLEAIGRALR